MECHSERSEESHLSVEQPLHVLCVELIPSMKGDSSSSVLRMTAYRTLRHSERSEESRLDRHVILSEAKNPISVLNILY